MRKRIFLFILTLALSININLFEVFAKETKNRVIFLVDISNSMNYQDNNNYTNEIMKMFIELLESTSTEIGIIAYNDQIILDYPKASLEKTETRNDMFEKINQIKRVGNTDIGLALKTAADVINTDEDFDNTIVLFSDGETDLRLSKTGRTTEDSINDEQYAYNIFSEKNCKVHTVGISRDGNLNKDYLKKISQKTGGVFYEVMKSENLINVFNPMFKNITGNQIYLKEYSNISSNIFKTQVPKKYFQEMNFLIQSDKKINNITLKNKYNNQSVNISKDFSSVKIIDPNIEEIEFEIDAQVGANIKITQIGYYSFYPVIDTENMEEFYKRDAKLTTKLISRKNNKVIDDKSFYQNLKCDINIINDKGDSENNQLSPDNNRFIYNYLNMYPHKINANAVVYNDFFELKSDNYEIEFYNNLPELIGNSKIDILKSKKNKEINLKKYFRDKDGDNLTFEINSILPSLEAGVEQDSLILSPNIESIEDMEIKVKDDRGGEIIKTMTLNIMPFWVYYKSVFIGVLIIFTVLLLIYILLKKGFNNKILAGTYEETEDTSQVSIVNPMILSANKKQSKFNRVRFEGYFLTTKSGIDIPILNWNAGILENRHIVNLGELFSLMDVTEKLPEAHKVFFEAGNNGTVIFYHNTDCIVTLQSRNIISGIKTVLNYDDKIYIVFEDHVTEIEIRYRRVGKYITA